MNVNLVGGGSYNRSNRRRNDRYSAGRPGAYRRKGIPSNDSRSGVASDDSQNGGYSFGDLLSDAESGIDAVDQEVNNPLTRTPTEHFEKAERWTPNSWQNAIDDGLKTGHRTLDDVGFRAQRHYREAKHYAQAYEEVANDEFLNPAKSFTRRQIDDAARFAGRYGDDVLNVAGKVGRAGRYVAGLPIDAALYTIEGLSIGYRWHTGKLSDREAMIKGARAVGGFAGSAVGSVVGGVVGGVAGAAVGGVGAAIGAPAGATVGGALGEMGGRKAGGWVAKQLLGSQNEKSVNRSVDTSSVPSGTRSRMEVHIPDSNSTAGPASGRRPHAPTPTSNRAKANKQQRQPERVVERHVERRPAPTPDVDRKIEEAKQDAIREMERRFASGPRPM